MAATFSSKPFFYDQRDLTSTATQDHEGSSYLSEPSRGVPRQRTSYFFPKSVGEYHFGERHPMKPHRLTLTNHLVVGYGLHKQMDVFQPQAASKQDLTAFHAEDYVDFLSKVTPDNVNEFSDVLSNFNIGDDCPIFDSMYDYCKQYSGASLAAARRLASGNTDIAVNWTGGLHHAKKWEASGFCYVNDIVLAILELLRIHPRVLYIDIDIHHGDGVQEAFYTSNRVLTVSFHKYAEHFFPGTGHIDELGSALGQYFSLNVPLQDGIDNESYIALFKSIMEPVIHTFQPSAIVLQCGADSLGNDRLGAFNLSISAHGECVRFIKAFDIPLLVVGGGGYTVKNVARCWTYETAVLLDQQNEISNTLPNTIYDDFFGPEYKLHPPLTRNLDNLNTRQGLERIRVGLLERLRFMHGAPSVAMQEIPPSLASWLEEEEEKRKKEDHEKDLHRDPREFYDSRTDQDRSSFAAGSQSSRKLSTSGQGQGTSRPKGGRSKSSAAGGNGANGGAGAAEKKRKRVTTGGTARGGGGRKQSNASNGQQQQRPPATSSVEGTPQQMELDHANAPSDDTQHLPTTSRAQEEENTTDLPAPESEPTPRSTEMEAS